MSKTTAKDETSLGSKENQYVTFCVGKEIYGIEVMRASEVMYLQEFTEVPDTMSFMKGVIDLRGTIVPLVDVRVKFKLPEKKYGIDTVIIILEYEDQRIGLIVDSVSDVLNLTLDDIRKLRILQMISNMTMLRAYQRWMRDLLSFLMWTRFLLMLNFTA